MAIDFSEAAGMLPPIPYDPPKCGLYHEAKRKLFAREMTTEQAIKWMESQPGWAPYPNCQCETCREQSNGHK